ncbi:hypothetical protein FALB51S_00829 [Frigidibacter albus]
MSPSLGADIRDGALGGLGARVDPLQKLQLQAVLAGGVDQQILGQVAVEIRIAAAGGDGGEEDRHQDCAQRVVIGFRKRPGQAQGDAAVEILGRRGLAQGGGGQIDGALGLLQQQRGAGEVFGREVGVCAQLRQRRARGPVAGAAAAAFPDRVADRRQHRDRRGNGGQAGRRRRCDDEWQRGGAEGGTLLGDVLDVAHCLSRDAPDALREVDEPSADQQEIRRPRRT